MNKKFALGCVGVVLLLALILAGSVGGSYNSLVQLDQATQALERKLGGVTIADIAQEVARLGEFSIPWSGS